MPSLLFCTRFHRDLSRILSFPLPHNPRSAMLGASLRYHLATHWVRFLVGTCGTTASQSILSRSTRRSLPSPFNLLGFPYFSTAAASARSSASLHLPDCRVSTSLISRHRNRHASGVRFRTTLNSVHLFPCACTSPRNASSSDWLKAPFPAYGWKRRSAAAATDLIDRWGRFLAISVHIPRPSTCECFFPSSQSKLPGSKPWLIAYFFIADNNT
mmetsp:Transcript_12675/g.36274  ORF Transcript_12675/g.36274 Transcript_12675/m.36274 type:complete len:214 (+) Transcript_12675:3609-4250(+)